MEADPEFTRDVESGSIRRVLVGFDGSKDAQHALHVARSLAIDLQGEIHVLMVIRRVAHAETSESLEQAIEAERKILSRGLNDEVDLGRSDPVSAVHVLVDDDPAGAIARYAKEFSFDLVVVGTHGRGRVLHPGVGRSVEALLQHCECPVLVV